MRFRFFCRSFVSARTLASLSRRASFFCIHSLLLNIVLCSIPSIISCRVRIRRANFLLSLCFILVASFLSRPFVFSRGFAQIISPFLGASFAPLRWGVVLLSKKLLIPFRVDEIYVAIDSYFLFVWHFCFVILLSPVNFFFCSRELL